MNLAGQTLTSRPDRFARRSAGRVSSSPATRGRTSPHSSSSDKPPGGADRGIQDVRGVHTQAHGLSSFGLVDEQVLAREVADSPELAAIIESQMGWAMVQLERMQDVDERGAALLARIEASEAR